MRRTCRRIQKDIGFEEPILPCRFRTTVLTDLYNVTKDITVAKDAAVHTTSAMTLKHYVKGKACELHNAKPIAYIYGLKGAGM